jgi:uroporphyrin-III C-methyltransferase
LYMAMTHLAVIVARLIAGGRRRDEPVAIVSNASTPEQQVLVSTLAEVVRTSATVETPAIIVVGEVVRLRAGLDWLGAHGGRRLVPDPLARANGSDH